MDGFNENVATGVHEPKPRGFAVIGAGAAGLCRAKYLVHNGFEDVTIFEIGTGSRSPWY